ncbi:helix-turn-helix transcriptional regulator [Arthrobacter sp. StoSoilB22]|uniref:helix-turn-helix domain-containing protein n=1 Tax=Arthrobacter sp. StoSoilB22 TaxID=2830996 RepID=UPI001CC76F69|nr:helix-turn-helix transcriptional regulator [Arthrobacter sp. StoSoilB22]
MPSGKQPESGQLARAFAAEVRAALARRRITAKQLALDTGLSSTYMGKRLRDESPFTLNDVEVICEKLGADSEAFRAAAAKALREAGVDDDPQE